MLPVSEFDSCSRLLKMSKLYTQHIYLISQHAALISTQQREAWDIQVRLSSRKHFPSVTFSSVHSISYLQESRKQEKFQISLSFILIILKCNCILVIFIFFLSQTKTQDFLRCFSFHMIALPVGPDTLNSLKKSLATAAKCGNQNPAKPGSSNKSAALPVWFLIDEHHTPSAIALPSSPIIYYIVRQS